MDWKRYFISETTKVNTREKWLSGFFAFVAILALGYLSFFFVGAQGTPYVVASVGAATVLVFAVPKSPLSQPWPLIGGHIVSATIGVTCHLYIESIPIALACAIGLSIVAMHYLRCLHPPGGAAALGAVLGGQEVEQLGFLYPLAPVGMNAVLLVLLAFVLNSFLKTRRYPNIHPEETALSTKAAQWALGPPRFESSDLQKALTEMNSVIDVSSTDLARIYALAVMNANKRRLGDVRSRDIMSTNPVLLHFDTEMGAAWETLRRAKIHAAPVVDHFDRPLGFVTLADFLHHATEHGHDNMRQRVQHFLKRTPGHTSDKPETIGQIMTSPVLTAREDQHIVELIPLFTEQGIHHLPVLDDKGKVCGMITRADVIKATLLVRN